MADNVTMPETVEPVVAAPLVSAGPPVTYPNNLYLVRDEWTNARNIVERVPSAASPTQLAALIGSASSTKYKNALEALIYGNDPVLTVPSPDGIGQQRYSGAELCAYIGQLYASGQKGAAQELEAVVMRTADNAHGVVPAVFRALKGLVIGKAIELTIKLFGGSKLIASLESMAGEDSTLTQYARFGLKGIAPAGAAIGLLNTRDGKEVAAFEALIKISRENAERMMASGTVLPPVIVGGHTYLSPADSSAATKRAVNKKSGANSQDSSSSETEPVIDDNHYVEARRNSDNKPESELPITNVAYFYDIDDEAKRNKILEQIRSSKADERAELIARHFSDPRVNSNVRITLTEESSNALNDNERAIFSSNSDTPKSALDSIAATIDGARVERLSVGNGELRYAIVGKDLTAAKVEHAVAEIKAGYGRRSNTVNMSLVEDAPVPPQSPPQQAPQMRADQLGRNEISTVFEEIVDASLKDIKDAYGVLPKCKGFKEPPVIEFAPGAVAVTSATHAITPSMGNTRQEYGTPAEVLQAAHAAGEELAAKGQNPDVAPRPANPNMGPVL